MEAAGQAVPRGWGKAALPLEEPKEPNKRGFCGSRGSVLGGGQLPRQHQVKHSSGILYQCFAGLAVVTVDAYKHWIFHKVKTEY